MIIRYLDPRGRFLSLHPTAQAAARSAVTTEERPCARTPAAPAAKGPASVAMVKTPYIKPSGLVALQWDPGIPEQGV